MSILDSLNSPEQLRQLDYSQLEQLAQEIRGFLIENVAKTGGHLASNLGVVELTLAIARIYDTGSDRLVFDVGHQCYVHKMITGRRELFETLRTLNGISGFPKPGESPHDAFIAGHASNSVSVALGMARARTLQKQDYDVVALIGDGALTGGLAYEGLCNAGDSGEPLVVILNDNGMSIDSNVGGVSNFLAELRLKPGYFNFKRRYRSFFKRFPAIYNFNHRLKEWLKFRVLPDNLFDDLGYEYFGPVDGHDLKHLEAVLRWAREIKAPALVHVITQKGRGYGFAEENPEAYHGVGCFDASCGIDSDRHEDFSESFGKCMEKLGRENSAVVAITAAMSGGTGLSGFAEKYPDRFFDVGIAEGHAVSMAAGMAMQGLTPVFAAYSSFLQRGYDMLIHDVALSGLHCIFAVDRAGLVGSDGETHQGSFDVSYLCSVPNMAVFSPSSYKELEDMLRLAVTRVTGPAAIRYPKGTQGKYKESCGSAPSTVLRKGGDITLVSYGIMINQVLAAAEILEEHDIQAEIIKLNFINPLDTGEVLRSVSETGRLLTVEDACSNGSVGQRLMSAVTENGLQMKAARRLDLGDGIVPHGTVSQLQELEGLDAQSIADAALEMCLPQS